ncbi:MAG: hypothetical protein R6U98_10140 [Pirellulaceae bacterium]
MESGPTQAVLSLVGLAAENVIRDRYNKAASRFKRAPGTWESGMVFLRIPRFAVYGFRANGADLEYVRLKSVGRGPVRLERLGPRRISERLVPQDFLSWFNRHGSLKTETGAYTVMCNV